MEQIHRRFTTRAYPLSRSGGGSPRARPVSDNLFVGLDILFVRVYHCCHRRRALRRDFILEEHRDEPEGDI